MGSFSIWHWLVVLAIVLVVFGTKKLRNMGSDLGGAVKNFREAMGEENKTAATGGQLEDHTPAGKTAADERQKTTQG